MKACPYCGKEYDDANTQCLIDGYALTQAKANLLAEGEKNRHPPATNLSAVTDHEPELKNQALVTYPDYRWSARDAWKCLGMFLLLGFIFNADVSFTATIFRPFRSWRVGPIGYVFMDLLRYGLFLLTAAYFARTETFKSFVQGFGLDHRPTDRAWFGLVAALIIRAFGHFVLVHRCQKA